MIVRRQRDDGHPLVDERDRTVFHLAGRIALGVDVGDFLEFQGTFKGNGIVDATAEIQKIGVALEPAGNFFHFWRNLERLFEHLRQLQQRVDVRL